MNGNTNILINEKMERIFKTRIFFYNFKTINSNSFLTLTGNAKIYNINLFRR